MCGEVALNTPSEGYASIGGELRIGDTPVGYFEILVKALFF